MNLPWRSRWVPHIWPVYTPASHTLSMVSRTCRYKSFHKIIEALVEYRAVFAGRCEICVHSDLTYHVDHAERSIYDGYTRQHRPCRIWWAILAVTSRYITLSRSNGPQHDTTVYICKKCKENGKFDSYAHPGDCSGEQGMQEMRDWW